jgi:hypothetical protein
MGIVSPCGSIGYLNLYGDKDNVMIIKALGLGALILLVLGSMGLLMSFG